MCQALTKVRIHGDLQVNESRKNTPKGYKLQKKQQIAGQRQQTTIKSISATEQQVAEMRAAEKRVVGVRLEDEMRDALAQKAVQNDRSLSREIVARLRKSLEQELSNVQNQQA